MPPSVSERKREEIARAALTLFARDGYERTSVDAIAASAGVSKRTVYSHYGDKENLFYAVVRDTFDLMRRRFGELLGQMAGQVIRSGEPEKAMADCIRSTVTEVLQSGERANLVRVVIAELPRFPRLLDLLQNRAILPIIIDQVTLLDAAGLLQAPDPEQAAGHLSALTFGQINSRSMMGTLPLSDTETDRIITSGVHVFLRAYGARQD